MLTSKPSASCLNHDSLKKNQDLSMQGREGYGWGSRLYEGIPRQKPRAPSCAPGSAEDSCSPNRRVRVAHSQTCRCYRASSMQCALFVLQISSFVSVNTAGVGGAGSRARLQRIHSGGAGADPGLHPCCDDSHRCRVTEMCISRCSHSWVCRANSRLPRMSNVTT